LESISLLNEFKSFKDKIGFIKSQKGLEQFQLILYSKKTAIKSLSLGDYFRQVDSEISISLNSFQVIEKHNKDQKELRSFCDFKSYNLALCLQMVSKNKPLGIIFIPYHKTLSNKSRLLILNFKTQIETQIETRTETRIETRTDLV
jgi:hypothetical protein